MEVPWSDFIVTPPSFSSSSQTAYPNDYVNVPPPPQDFSSCFPVLSQDGPFEQFDCSSGLPKPSTSLNQPFSPPLTTPVLDLNEIENRSLLVTNVNPDTTEDEIQKLFSSFGDIRSLDTASLESGSFTIEYFDLRRANQARRNCNNALLHNSIISVVYAPLAKIDDPRKPPNNGTIVVFHLPTGITNQQIESSFGTFGEIRQVRGTPAKPNQKFIEYWDIRDAQKALDALNGQYVMGSRVSIEFSLPGGFRRNVQRPEQSFRT
jgi:RNA recognition motif-containing protein